MMGSAFDNLTILSVSPGDFGGGAERVAMNLHRAYLERSVDSWLAVGTKISELPNTIEIPNIEHRTAWAQALLGVSKGPQRRSTRVGDTGWALSRSLRVLAEPARYLKAFGGHEDFSFPASEHVLDLPPTPPDILHIHNMHGGGYFDIRALPSLSRRVSTVVTLHDSWILTGHCAHPLECSRWKSGCGRCPDLGLYVPIRRDASAVNWSVKRAVLAASQLHVATPSRWLMRMVEASGIDADLCGTRVIPNGIDLEVFRPGDKAEARFALGLPEDHLVLLVSARIAEANPFKDYPTLVEALPLAARRLDSRILLVVLGSDGQSESIEGIDILPVGFTEDSSLVAEYYRASDIYVHPARAENLPLAIIEALACGTPVVASRVGGVPEIITGEDVGILVPPRDSEALAAAVVRLAEDEGLRARMASTTPGIAADRFALDKQADAYLDWYAEIIDSGCAGDDITVP